MSEEISNVAGGLMFGWVCLCVAWAVFAGWHLQSWLLALTVPLTVTGITVIGMALYVAKHDND